MQAQTLAEQFNDVSAELERRGHGVVVRRARAFIEAGRVADAVEFLHRAQASMASDRAVAGLSSGLRAFHEAGADAAALARTTAWREGVEREAQVALQDAARREQALRASLEQLPKIRCVCARVGTR